MISSYESGVQGVSVCDVNLRALLNLHSRPKDQPEENTLRNSISCCLEVFVIITYEQLILSLFALSEKLR